MELLHVKCIKFNVFCVFTLKTKMFSYIINECSYVSVPTLKRSFSFSLLQVVRATNFDIDTTHNIIHTYPFPMAAMDHTLQNSRLPILPVTMRKNDFFSSQSLP